MVKKFGSSVAKESYSEEAIFRTMGKHLEDEDSFLRTNHERTKEIKHYPNVFKSNPYSTHFVVYIAHCTNLFFSADGPGSIFAALIKESPSKDSNQ